MMKNKDSSAELKCDGAARKHMNIKAFPHDELGKVMTEWSEGMCPVNLSINGSIIREKAAWVALKLSFEKFKAFNGWFDRIKKWQRLTYTK
jgi:hypothetical protein